MAKIKSEISPVQLQKAGQQQTMENTSPSEQQTLEQTVPSENSSIQRIKPRFSSWPSSKPGPRSTQPPMGMHSVNVFRPEQVAEIAYSGQSAGDGLEHSMSDTTAHGSIRIDQTRNAQEVLGKRKVRL
jgi:hypothetical protein